MLSAADYNHDDYENKPQIRGSNQEYHRKAKLDEELDAGRSYHWLGTIQGFENIYANKQFPLTNENRFGRLVQLVNSNQQYGRHEDRV